MKKIPIKNKIKNLKPSSTLAINEKSKDLIKKGKKIYRFGFGQSPFPVPEKIVECLKLNAEKKDYLPVIRTIRFKRGYIKISFKKNRKRLSC